VAKSALVEGIAHLRKGLRLIADLADPAGLNRQKIDLQLALGTALMAAQGYAHPEVVESFITARRLVAEIGATGTLLDFSVLWGLWTTNYVGGNAEATLHQAKELLSIADQLGESGLVLIGHRVLGSALTINADYQGALTHLERAVALYKPAEHSRFTSRFAHDIGVTAYAAWSWALWHRGYLEKADDAAAKAVQYAEQSAHMPTLAYALFYTGTIAVFGRRVAEAERLANALVELASDRGFVFFLAYGLILQGWVMVQRGRVSMGTELICKGLTMSQRMGARAI
jgi:tetratricopeptide (TPR) repeat protein